MKRTPQSTASIERKVPMNKIEVGKSASPNIKNVRSKIGSLDNATYKPGGGKVKIESKKLDFSRASSKIAAKNEAYVPGGGDKKIEVVKLKWSASSKIGSLDNKAYKPGGGDKKVETVKLDFKDKAQSKIGSKENIKHKAGGGDVEICVIASSLNVRPEPHIASSPNVRPEPHIFACSTLGINRCDWARYS
ncbi:Microtubule-associated protein tau [Armadillidium vulgare]|nr:Microtubule-associated protein tau [Armadillidium vulgare]